MLTGSAAQPRSGTAPKAPAASAVLRNLRRLGRFARSLWLATTDCPRSLFMPSSPEISDPAGPSALLLARTIVARLKVVYNIVFNIIIAIGGYAGGPLG